ncbi:DUF4386 domain-containing protein [Bacillus sp. FJAT-28004]|uniref:DUF4386 domain-containing protein n=1 Tax=Bacillus sp. FJAT-28004 TaxID=1679165 RepID=UPI0006B5E9EC|nr:DUF4386 domain-containing protein [Bacillus sp. FJAT-28004]
MISNKKTAVIVGVLFFIATVAYMVGNGLVESVLNKQEYLNHLYPDRSKVIIGMFLELINSAAVVSIAMLMFPILKKQNEAIALGYFGSRIMESVLLIVSIIGLQLLVILSQEYIASGAVDSEYFQTIGTLVVKGQHAAFDMGMLALSLGSLMFCYLMYRSKLIPRIISVIGLIGYAALFASGCLGIFGLDVGMILYIPGAIFEIIFPIWLIVKGFNLTAINAVTPKR